MLIQPRNDSTANAGEPNIGCRLTGMEDADLEVADAAARLLEAEQRSVLNQLCALTPVTVAGCAALAHSMVLLRPDLLRAGPTDDPDMRLLAVLLRGLAGQA